MRQILITVAGRNSAGKSLIAKKVAEARAECCKILRNQKAKTRRAEERA